MVNIKAKSSDQLSTKRRIDQMIVLPCVSRCQILYKLPEMSGFLVTQQSALSGWCHVQEQHYRFLCFVLVFHSMLLFCLCGSFNAYHVKDTMNFSSSFIRWIRILTEQKYLILFRCPYTPHTPGSFRANLSNIR